MCWRTKGHWLGLLHVFQNALEYGDEDADPCDPLNTNDHVEDTPVIRGPTQSVYKNCFVFLQGEAEIPDTCPNLEGKDPIFNFMNYLVSWFRMESKPPEEAASNI